MVFGFGIVRFQFLLSKMDLSMDDLKVTLSDMIDDYNEARREVLTRNPTFNPKTLPLTQKPIGRKRILDPTP